MNLLQIADLGHGQVQLSWRVGDRSRCCPLVPFADPLTTEDRAELRWYLEEFLSFPYGAERWKAAQVEDKMARWGEALFGQVFPKQEQDPDPRGFYQEAVREGLDHCELAIASDDPEFLNIPWELLRDPTPGRGYLALSLAGLYRQRSGRKIEVPAQPAAAAPFRILLVIARPYGKRDVPLGTVARPVVEAVRPFRSQIELEVLRPPTFDALQSHLNARPGHYRLVHFDGHGVFAGSAAGPLMEFRARAERGHLVFEKEDGTEHVVDSHELGQALAAGHVPLFVLNACQSAEGGKRDAFSSVAGQLVAAGATGVVAMSYSVWASAAALFIERFYEKLVRQEPLSEAVAAARQRLHASPHRGSVIGRIELADWMVPVLYQQQARYVPFHGRPRKGAEAQADVAEVLKLARERCPEGRFGFIGRDYDLLRIERALRRDDRPWALLAGMGGIGKTELARGFARWYAETGGCPGGVFPASFKEKADFGQVAGSIAGFATDFSRLPEAVQREKLIDRLRGNACLLVWDNFEPVAGYPEGAEPLATVEERAKLAAFLQALRGGRSRVLITTRKQNEDWLGIACELVELEGLTERDAGGFARLVLATAGKTPEEFRDDPHYARLIGLLNGHPRSLEVVLPHLRRSTPREIIDSLQHRTDQLGEAMEDASLAYAFLNLSERTRRHLPFLGLFVSFVHAGTLGTFVGPGSPCSAPYVALLGETLDADGWEEILEEAARGGLLRSQGGRIYDLHPTFPPFLRCQLRATVGEDGLRRLDTEFVSFYSAWAHHVFEEVRKAGREVLSAVACEEGNLLRALNLAGAGENWAEAHAIGQTLGEAYLARGRTPEWNSVLEWLLSVVGEEVCPEWDRDRANLWMFLVGKRANEALARSDLDGAEAAFQRVVRYLLSLRDPAVEPQLAVGYHQLGLVAERRERFDEAEQFYHKARDIRERLELERNVCADYHHLGNVAFYQKRFDEARQWYHKALAIRERLGWDRWAATDYFQLGIVAWAQGRLDEAEQWERRALHIFDHLRLEREAAHGYHALGNLALVRERLEEAEECYRKALEIFERLGPSPAGVETLAQFGLLRALQGRPTEAVQWSGKALRIATEYELPLRRAVLRHLAGHLDSLGEPDFTSAWQQAFPGQEPPLEAIRNAAEKPEPE